MSKKIKLIVCYFGKLPEYFPLWLRSCERNFNIDFLVYSDQSIPSWLPKNVDFVRVEFGDIRERFQNQLNFKISLDNYYKLCDFKPLFGLAFQEELKDYEYWGHCDIDLIWGNLEKYLAEKLTEKYDRIGPAGHFSIYRNTEVVNNSFSLNGGTFDYKDVFSNPENFAFDEMTGMNMILKKNSFSFYDEVDYADISTSYSRIRLNRNDYPHEVFYWDDGSCYRSYEKSGEVITEEYMYIHFQKRKLENHIPSPQDTTSFAILSDGFHPKYLGEPNLNYIKENNIFEGTQYEKFEKLKNRVNKIKGIVSMSHMEKKIWIKQQFSLKILNNKLR